MRDPTGRPTVVVTHWIHEEVVDLLARTCDVVPNQSPETLAREEVMRRASGADALLAFMPDLIDAGFIEGCPRLKIVAGALKGPDNIDVEACTQRGVWVTAVQDLLTVPTAELAIGLLLALSRNIVDGDRRVRSGVFSGWRPQLYGTQLHGSAVGIVGMGAIGRSIARQLAGFRTAIAYTDPSPVSAGEGIEAVRMELSALLQRSDFVVVTAPLNARTRHLIDAGALAQMKPGAYLANIGRGSVVDEEAVQAALANGRLGGYAADVFEFEDWALPDRPHAIHPGLVAQSCATVLTPHLGSAVDDTRRAIALQAATSILEALRGEAPRAAINDPHDDRRCTVRRPEDRG